MLIGPVLQLLVQNAPNLFLDSKREETKSENDWKQSSRERNLPLIISE
jgi:hypothetical protein